MEIRIKVSVYVQVYIQVKTSINTCPVWGREGNTKKAILKGIKQQKIKEMKG